MTFPKNKRVRAATEFKILEKTIGKRALLQEEWESNTDISFEDGLRVKIKTDINFANVNGYTLLDLAIISGDIDKAKELIEEGGKSDKALLLSLGLGSKELTSIMFQKQMSFDYSDLTGTKANVDGFNISIEMLEHFRGCVAKKITDDNGLTTPEIDNKGRNPLHHYAFLNFESSKQNIEKYPDEKLNIWINAKDKAGYTPLYYACLAGNIEYINYLVERGANIEEDFVYRDNKTNRTPLFISSVAGRVEVVQKLIELGAEVKSDIVGKMPLSFAIANNNVDLIKLFLSTGSKLINSTDNYQRNIMHVLAKNGNTAVCDYILSQSFVKNLLNERDVFGKTPLDIAREEGNENFINAYSRYHQSPKQYQASSHIDLKQGSLNATLIHYLNLTNQNSDIIDPIGTCNGLAFLKSIYSNRSYLAMLEEMKANARDPDIDINELLSTYYEDANSIKNDYYKIKDLLGSWNGSYEDLEKHIGIKLHDYPEDTTLKELFREWSEHVAWFHQDKISSEFQELNKSQRDRENQINSLGIKNFTTENDVVSAGSQLVNEEQLEELLSILSTKPGTKLYLSGGQHIVSIFCPAPGQLDFYDPNIENKLPLYTDFSKLSKDILNIKYLGLAKHTVEDDKILMRVDWTELKSEGWPHTLSSNKSTFIPSTQQDIEKFINDSPNHFNQLHRAILENNIQLAKSLLSNPELDFNQKDKFFNKTPKELCFQLRRKELIQEYIRQDKNGDELMQKYINESNYDLVDILLECGVELNSNEIIQYNAPSMGSINVETLMRYIDHFKPEQFTQDHGFEPPPLDNVINAINQPNVYGFVQELIKRHPAILDNVKITPEAIFEHLRNKKWGDIEKLMLIKNDFVNGKVNDTPLLAYLAHFANDNDDNAKSLILSFVKNGVDVNAQAPSGKTPLHLAVYAEPPKTEIIMLLCKNGAIKSLGLKDTSGQTPLDILKSKGHEKLLNDIQNLTSPVRQKAMLFSKYSDSGVTEQKKTGELTENSATVSQEGKKPKKNR